MFRVLKDTTKLAIEAHEARAAAAIEYWGPLINPTTKMSSPIFTRLITAVYDRCVSLSLPSIPISVFKRHEKGCLQPEIVSSVLSDIGLSDVSFDLKIMEMFGIRTIDMRFCAFYESFEIPFSKNEKAIPESNGIPARPVSTCPLLSCNGLQEFITFLVVVDPDTMQGILTKFLRENELVDPLTGKAFCYKKIPRVCLPAASDAVANAKFDAARAMFDRMDTAILDMAMRTFKANEAATIAEYTKSVRANFNQRSWILSSSPQRQRAKRNQAAINAAHARVQAAAVNYEAKQKQTRAAYINGRVNAIMAMYSIPGVFYTPYCQQQEEEWQQGPARMAKEEEERALLVLREEQRKWREIYERGS